MIIHKITSKNRSRGPWLLALAVLAAGLPDFPAFAEAGQTPQAAEGPELVLELPWGSGGTMLGRIDGNESASVGPFSFTVSPAGDIYILDQVNLRIVKVFADGSWGGDVALPAPRCEDIAVAQDGSIVLLDRLDRKAVFVLDGKTGTVREAGVEGKGIPEGGLVTAMFLENDGVWLEVENAWVVRILDAALLPGDRTVLLGRKFDGLDVTLIAKRLPPRGARLWLQELDTGAVAAGKDFGFPYDLERIIFWGRDSRKNIVAVFHLMQQGDQHPYPVVHEAVVGLRLDRNLVETGSFSSPYPAREWMQLKEFEVDPGGAVWQMAFTDAGVKILRWRWKP